jgi:hypothetical protein
MAGPLVAIVGDTNPTRTFNPPLKDPAMARKAAEELGAELARRGARLLVYGGPFVEADVVRGFVSANPAADHSILMWYTIDQEPPAFPEEKTHGRLFQRRGQRGAEWEIAFYRSIAKADGVVLIGGANSTKIAGQVAIGSRMPILSLATFGGAAASVWDTLSAGEDLPTRDEIDLMGHPWTNSSAAECVKALLAQHARRQSAQAAPRPILSFLAAILFFAALGIVPYVWGQNAFSVWMLFLAPVLAGGAGGAIRPLIDHGRGTALVAPAVFATLVLGLIAGGVAGVLFVTAQLTADPELAVSGDLAKYAQRSIPFAVAVGFGAGFTSDAVFGKLLGLDVVRVSGIEAGPPRATS